MPKKPIGRSRLGHAVIYTPPVIATYTKSHPVVSKTVFHKEVDEHKPVVHKTAEHKEVEHKTLDHEKPVVEHKTQA